MRLSSECHEFGAATCHDNNAAAMASTAGLIELPWIVDATIGFAINNRRRTTTSTVWFSSWAPYVILQKKLKSHSSSLVESRTGGVLGASCAISSSHGFVTVNYWILFLKFRSTLWRSLRMLISVVTYKYTLNTYEITANLFFRR